MTNLRQDDLNSRNASADILKVLSIFAVVFIHGSFLISDSATVNNSDYLQKYVTVALRFCVPVFIFLWAFFTERTIIKKGVGAPLSRLFKLLIPFLFWSMLYFLYTYDFNNLHITTIITKHWVGYGWSGQYYFIILFQLIILFGIIRKLAIMLIKCPGIIVICSIVIFALITYTKWFQYGIISKLSYRPFIYWLPYVCLGIQQAHRNIFKYSIDIRWGLLSLGLICVEVYFFDPDLANLYLLPSVFLCSMILLSSICSKLTYGSLPSTLRWGVQKLSNSTLGIFCLNPLIILILSPLLKFEGSLPQILRLPFLLPLISTLIIISLCLLIIYLLKKIRLGIIVSN